MTLGPGDLYITRGVESRGPAFVYQALTSVQDFDAFTPDNDPFGEHDFGVVHVENETVFWKIDLYEKGDVKHRLDRPSRVRRRVDALPPIAAGLLHCNVTSRWANRVHWRRMQPAWSTVRSPRDKRTPRSAPASLPLDRDVRMEGMGDEGEGDIVGQ